MGLGVRGFRGRVEDGEGPSGRAEELSSFLPVLTEARPTALPPPSPPGSELKLRLETEALRR